MLVRRRQAEMLRVEDIRGLLRKRSPLVFLSFHSIPPVAHAAARAGNRMATFYRRPSAAANLSPLGDVYVGMLTLTQDVRYGIRTLTRTPGFSLIAIAVLAIGIGANVTVFSLANALFLRPLPAGDPSSLVRVYSNRYSNTRYRSYLELRDRNSTL